MATLDNSLSNFARVFQEASASQREAAEKAARLRSAEIQGEQDRRLRNRELNLREAANVDVARTNDARTRLMELQEMRAQQTFDVLREEANKNAEANDLGRKTTAFALRKQVAQNMIASGASAKEIEVQTGLSKDALFGIGLEVSAAYAAGGSVDGANAALARLGLPGAFSVENGRPVYANGGFRGTVPTTKLFRDEPRTVGAVATSGGGEAGRGVGSTRVNTGGVAGSAGDGTPATNSEARLDSLRTPTPTPAVNLRAVENSILPAPTSDESTSDESIPSVLYDSGAGSDARLSKILAPEWLDPAGPGPKPSTLDKLNNFAIGYATRNNLANPRQYRDIDFIDNPEYGRMRDRFLLLR